MKTASVDFFVESVAAEVRSFVPDDASRARCEALQTGLDRQRDANTFDAASALRLEKAILDCYSDPLLRRKIWALRDRYGLAAGPAAFQKYLASNPPDPATAARAELIADMEVMLDQIYAGYVFALAREHLVGRVKKVLSIAVVVIIVAGSAVALTNTQNMWLVWMIMVSGWLGALTSIMRRLQAASTLGSLQVDPAVELVGLEHGWTGMIIALASGAIFSLLLYLVFIGGLLPIPGVTPDFVVNGAPPPAGVNLAFLADQVGPKAPADYAKVIVWSFAAGFAERLVPDVLDRIVARSEQAQG
jgi:hypothetical protein